MPPPLWPRGEGYGPVRVEVQQCAVLQGPPNRCPSSAHVSAARGAQSMARPDRKLDFAAVAPVLSSKL
eukprot:90601-Prorocentrum_lima.AAC.1